MLQQRLFNKYFTLDEAVQLIPFVRETFDTAHRELADLKDDIVLYKRIHELQTEEGIAPGPPGTHSAMEKLHHKWHAYEARFYHWINVLTEKGIQVRDFKKGLIDFPYRTKDGTEYFLCWHLGEEGLFYFHDIYEGYLGRKPITLLLE